MRVESVITGDRRCVLARSMAEPRKYQFAVSLVIRHPDDTTRFVVVQRPATDANLPNAWGLPAGMVPAPEPPQDSDFDAAVITAGVQKMGLNLRLDGPAKGESSLERPGYTLVMRQYEAVPVGRAEGSCAPVDGGAAVMDTASGEGFVLPIVPQPQYASVTQYQAWRWGTLSDLSEAAAKGSLCSRMLLARSGQYPA
jgi:hypothetical protein